MVGILDRVAADQHVTAQQAGHLITAYAIGICLGGPAVTALLARRSRHTVLLVAVGAFCAANLLAAASSGMTLLLIARLIAGAAHGSFVGAATVVAAALVPPQRRGQAVALVFGGIAVSAVIGAPLGTAIGQLVGWRTTFLGLTALAGVALLAVALLVPSVQSPASASGRSQWRPALTGPIVALDLAIVLTMGGLFTAFTYIQPFLATYAGIEGATLSLFLLAFGLASVAGTAIGGRGADRSPTRTMRLSVCGLVIALAALAMLGAIPILAGVALAAAGFAGFAFVPAFQVRNLQLAGNAADLAATLGASSANAGIALGSVLGGFLLQGSAQGPMLGGVAVTGLAVLVTVVATRWAGAGSGAGR